MKERVEVALIGTTIALGADMVDVFYTMTQHGFSWVHAIVLLILSLGMLFAVSELKQQHTINFKCILKCLKLKRQQKKHNKQMMARSVR